jgi:hypothetical protein
MMRKIRKLLVSAFYTLVFLAAIFGPLLLQSQLSDDLNQHPGNEQASSWANCRTPGPC